MSTFHHVAIHFHLRSCAVSVLFDLGRAGELAPCYCVRCSVTTSCMGTRDAGMVYAKHFLFCSLSCCLQPRARRRRNPHQSPQRRMMVVMMSDHTTQLVTRCQHPFVRTRERKRLALLAGAKWGRRQASRGCKARVIMSDTGCFLKAYAF